MQETFISSNSVKTKKKGSFDDPVRNKECYVWDNELAFCAGSCVGSSQGVLLVS